MTVMSGDFFLVSFSIACLLFAAPRFVRSPLVSRIPKRWIDKRADIDRADLASIATLHTTLTYNRPLRTFARLMYNSREKRLDVLSLLLFGSIIVVNLIVNDRLNSYGEAPGKLFLL